MARIKTNFRKSFFTKRGNLIISIEAGLFSKIPSIGIVIDGPDNEICFHVSLLSYIYVKFPWPKKWSPSKISSYDNTTILPEERSFILSFHDWTLWWEFWKLKYEWNSTDPKWMSGCVHFDDILFGKHKCEFRDSLSENHIISFYEGNYRVLVTKKERIDSWPRWFTKRSIAYNVEAIPKAIPVNGKGENSWDCGETATSSCHFPARECQDCYDAALYFEKHMKESRRKYGGYSWIPKEHLNKELLFA